MTALALDAAELPEAVEAVDHRTEAIAAGLCPQCLHSTKDGAHSRYGSHCRWTQGRSECLCQGPIENRGPR
jgi:hypothetical protein